MYPCAHIYQGTAPTRSFMSLWHPIKCSCRMKSTLAVSPGSSWYGWCNKWTHVNTCWSDVWIQWSRWMYFSLPLLIGMGHTYMVGPTAILEWHQPPDSLYLFLPLPIMLFDCLFLLSFLFINTRSHSFSPFLDLSCRSSTKPRRSRASIRCDGSRCSTSKPGTGFCWRARPFKTRSRSCGRFCTSSWYVPE